MLEVFRKSYVQSDAVSPYLHILLPRPPRVAWCRRRRPSGPRTLRHDMSYTRCTSTPAHTKTVSYYPYLQSLFHPVVNVAPRANLFLSLATCLRLERGETITGAGLFSKRLVSFLPGDHALCCVAQQLPRPPRKCFFVCFRATMLPETDLRHRGHQSLRNTTASRRPPAYYR